MDEITAIVVQSQKERSGNNTAKTKTDKDKKSVEPVKQEPKNSGKAETDDFGIEGAPFYVRFFDSFAKMSWWEITLAILAPILIGLTIILTIFTVQSNNAKAALGDLSVFSNAKVVGANNKLTPFYGQKIEKANVKQKALGYNSKDGVMPASLVFRSSKTDNPSKAQINSIIVYMDFAQQRSRDFILSNQNLLYSMIKNNRLTLAIRPIPSGNPISVYEPEALAESFYLDNTKSWNFFIDLLKYSATYSADKKGSPKDVAEEIVKLAEKNGIKGIDTSSIRNGTFASWFLSVGNDAAVKKLNFNPPAIYINGKFVNDTKNNLNNSDNLRKFLE